MLLPLRRAALLVLSAMTSGLMVLPASPSPQAQPQLTTRLFMNPRLTGEALYNDLDSSHTLSSADSIVVRFDLPVVVLQNNAAAFRLPVSGDSFGSGASVIAGPAADQVTIHLGSGAGPRPGGRLPGECTHGNRRRGAGRA